MSKLEDLLTPSQSKQEIALFEIFIKTFNDIFPPDLLPKFTGSFGNLKCYDLTFTIALTPKIETAFMVKQLTFQFFSILLLKTNPANSTSIKQETACSPMLKSLDHFRLKFKPLIFKLLSRPDLLPLVLTDTQSSDDIFTLFVCELFSLYYDAEAEVYANIDEIIDMNDAVSDKIAKLYPKACSFMSYYREMPLNVEDEEALNSKIQSINRQCTKASSSEDYIAKTVSLHLKREWHFKHGICESADRDPTNYMTSLYKFILDIDCLSLLSSSESNSSVQAFRFMQSIQFMYLGKSQYNRIFSDVGEIRLLTKDVSSRSVLTGYKLDFYSIKLDISKILTTKTQSGINRIVEEMLKGLVSNINLAVTLIESHVYEHHKFPIAWLEYLIQFVEYLRKPYLPFLGYFTVRLACMLADQHVLNNNIKQALSLLKSLVDSNSDLHTGTMSLKIAEIAAKQNLSSDIKIELEYVCRILGIKYYDPKDANSILRMSLVASPDVLLD